MQHRAHIWIGHQLIFPCLFTLLIAVFLMVAFTVYDTTYFSFICKLRNHAMCILIQIVDMDGKQQWAQRCSWGTPLAKGLQETIIHHQLHAIKPIMYPIASFLWILCNLAFQNGLPCTKPLLVHMDMLYSLTFMVSPSKNSFRFMRLYVNIVKSLKWNL